MWISLCRRVRKAPPLWGAGGRASEPHLRAAPGCHRAGGMGLSSVSPPSRAAGTCRASGTRRRGLSVCVPGGRPAPACRGAGFPGTPSLGPPRTPAWPRCPPPLPPDLGRSLDPPSNPESPLQCWALSPRGATHATAGARWRRRGSSTEWGEGGHSHAPRRRGAWRPCVTTQRKPPVSPLPQGILHLDAGGGGGDAASWPGSRGGRTLPRSAAAPTRACAARAPRSLAPACRSPCP